MGVLVRREKVYGVCCVMGFHMQAIQLYGFDVYQLDWDTPPAS